MQYKILDSTRLNDAYDPLAGISKQHDAEMKIKRANLSTSLQAMVREHMKKGWRPLGGVGSWGGEAQPPEFYQAMVKD